MWVVVYIAEGLSAKERAHQLLEENGIVCKAKPLYKNRPDEKNSYQIIVLQSEAEEAMSLFLENGF